MTALIVDIEGDGYYPSRIWCIVTKDVHSNEVRTFVGDEQFEEFKALAPSIRTWIAHSGLSYDIPHLNRLLGTQIDYDKVVDTFVVSRLVNYSKYNTHSLEELGLSLGVKKGVFNDFSQYSDEMLKYCIQDVEVTHKVFQQYKRFIEDPAWRLSLFIEHKMALICQDMHNNGFYFNKTMAERVLQSINDRMIVLEAEFQRQWPPELREVGSIKYRFKQDGTLFANVQGAIDRMPKTEVRGDDLILYDYIGFNPGSTKDRVEKLWESGWQPTEKTDGHYKFSMKAKPGEVWGSKVLSREEYNEKKKHFEFYGWTVNEENLETLPETAPEGAKALAEWLTLNGRKTALEERLRCFAEDFRIHTKFWHIGTWTHRMSHSNPNLANISSPFHGEPRNAVERVKAEYDASLREMFTVESGYLVGTDAESIQLRILAHYLKNDDYVQAIVSGRKQDETDIHNVNRRALGIEGITRDHAKTFIYAWLLGAGTAKVARILGCSLAQAKQAVDSFIRNTHGLGELKRGLIKRDAGRGYFVGLDGRKVICSSDYLMLAGYLQNGEAVVMKYANILWREWADKEKINYKQVNFVHDEWQTQVYDSLDAAQRLGQLQCEALTEVGKMLNVYCPLSGETRIGQTWLDTH